MPASSVMNMSPRTLFEKVWGAHCVVQGKNIPSVLYIDLHLIHEVTSPQAFALLRERGLKVRRPDRTVATIDHSIPTDGRDIESADPIAATQIRTLEQNTAEFGVRLIGRGHEHRGIVHVIGPELGLTQPGMTIVCGDSHTSTHGAFGALAFGIGTTEVGHVLATQCLLQYTPRTFEVRVEGNLSRGVSAKDVILALIARVGIDGGTGCVIEYTGSVFRAMSMEERMTICNMTIEAGARAGMIAPDATTWDYLAGRPHAPRGKELESAVSRWSALASDAGAMYDRSEQFRADEIQPMITYGTNPGMGMPVTACVPDPSRESDASRKTSLENALRYMSLRPGQPLLGHPVDVVFIGSCTNSRISDLREAASVMRGRHVAPGMRVLVVPGSELVRREAEREGLDCVFRDAGAEWREPGCSMCIAMNGDSILPGQYAVSTSNRNFEGRQGPGGRTFLASPMTAAAAAVSGSIVDARRFLKGE